MKQINNFRSLNDSFSSMSYLIDSEGNTIIIRGKTCKEITFASVKIQDPTDLHITCLHRKFNFLYSISEFLWYLSCDPRVVNIGKLAKTWNEIADHNGEVVSNYGKIVRDQWDWTILELTRDTNSRRATLTINHPANRSRNDLDCPCTMYVQFFIRNGKLDMFVSMRSNDLVFGFCNDVFCWCLFQQMMLNELKEKGLTVELGSYLHTAGSLHVYEKHIDLLKNYAIKTDENRGKIRMKHHFTWKYAETNRKIMPSHSLSKEELETNAIKFFSTEIDQ